MSPALRILANHCMALWTSDVWTRDVSSRNALSYRTRAVVCYDRTRDIAENEQ